jgi:uncharacterized membrane protein
MTLIYCFFVFSLLGWIIEALYRSMVDRRFINPGFLMGPYLPIYGFGGLIILAGYALLPSYSLPVRAVFYFVSLTALEFLVGFFMEKIFGIRLWDYRSRRFNLYGYVCLRFSLHWTVLAVMAEAVLRISTVHGGATWYPLDCCLSGGEMRGPGKPMTVFLPIMR